MSQSCCLQSVTGVPSNFRDGLDLDNSALPSDSQVIVTSYEFTCCGNITGWLACVHPDGPAHQNGLYSIAFQVWRQADMDGCYNMVEEDTYNSIQLDREGVARRLLEPANFLPVQPGDVIGYIVTRQDRTNVEEGIQLLSELNEEGQGESVWYSNGVTWNPNSCLSVGTGGMLTSFTNSAPILTVDLGKY